MIGQRVCLFYPMQIVFVCGVGYTDSRCPSVTFWFLQGVSNKQCLLTLLVTLVFPVLTSQVSLKLNSCTWIIYTLLSKYNSDVIVWSFRASGVKSAPSEMSENKCTLGHVRPAKIQVSLRIRTVWSDSSLCTFWIAKDANVFPTDNDDSLQTASGAYVRRYIFSSGGSLNDNQEAN